MVSSDTTAGDATGIHPLPRRSALERLFRTLAPSAVRMVGAGFQFLSTVMVARTLGDGPSALFFFWSSVLMSSGPIASYGLEQIALRNVPRLERHGADTVARFVANLRGMSLALALLLGLVWSVYAVATQPAPGGFRLWHLLPLFAQGAISLTLINGEVLKGLSHPVLGNVFGHVLPAGLFCGLVALALLFGRPDSPGVLALYAGSFVGGAALAHYAPCGSYRGRFLLWPDRATFRTLLREGFPVCCVSLFGALGFIVPLAICEATRPAAEVSHLTAAFRIAILFIVLSGAIHGVFAPALSRSAELSRPLGPVMRVYGKSIGIALLTLAPALVVGIAFPDWVMSIFGGEFRDGAGALRLLLVVQLLSLLMGPVPYLLLMTGHSAFLARLGVVKFLLVVLLSLLLIPRMGGNGMVLAMGIAFLGEGIIGIAYAVSKMRSRETQEPDAA